MGIEGNDFIANPNRLEYVDDGELDLDEHPEVILDYVRDADDYFGVDDDDDDDDYVSEDDALNDRPNEEDPLSSDEFTEDIGLEYSSNFLTDEEDDDDDADLQLTLIDGMFVQTGGPIFHHSYNTRSMTAAAAAASTSTSAAPNAVEDNASKNTNANANGNVEGEIQDGQQRVEGS